MVRIVKCRGCGNILNSNSEHSDFKNCDKCGSTDIMYHLIFSENVGIQIHETIKGKVKEEGIKKPRKEFIYGEDVYKNKNEWVDKTRIIDRENDHYYEKVVDKNGQVLHECDELLSEHWGHGSAKKKNIDKS